MIKSAVVFIFVLSIICGCGQIIQPPVKTGLDRVQDFEYLFRGKRLGIITNHTAYTYDDKHIIDVLSEFPDVQIVALFGPEHGIRGTERAGQNIPDSTDNQTAIPVYSLYGAVRKPTREMLQSVDVLVYDIQDIGARYYTYISTMCLAMEAAGQNDIPFIVLDRPNPINGTDVEGNLLDTAYSSFVGLYPIPVRHGMTSGEIAMMVNGEGWLAEKMNTRLSIIPMYGWERSMWYDQTGLTWRPTSPNIPDLSVATVYPGTCLFEGTNVSEGRGTYQPFLQIGAPWLLPSQVEIINKMIDMPGVRLAPISFIPKSIPSMSPRPKHLGETVFGVSIKVTNRRRFMPYITGIALVKLFYDINEQSFKWRRGHFDRLCGTDQIRRLIESRKSIEEIKEWIDKDISAFVKTRSKYLIY
jgi:uncharacterized protein YbbC (DUF1343 family)